MSLDLFTANWFPKVITADQCKTMTDEELLQVLKSSDDFEKLVLPVSWHKKYPDLPKATCSDTKTFIKDAPWTKKHHNYYIANGRLVAGGRLETVDAKPGGLRPILPAPEIPTLTLIQNSFSDAPIDQTESEHPQETQ